MGVLIHALNVIDMPNIEWYKETRERFAEGKIGNERVNAMVDTILSLLSLSNV